MHTNYQHMNITRMYIYVYSQTTIHTHTLTQKYIIRRFQNVNLLSNV